jgi:WXG100 family type VII secretion target
MRIEADTTGLQSAARDFDRAVTELHQTLASLSGPADSAAQGAGLAAPAFESMWAAWSSVLSGLSGRLQGTGAALRQGAHAYAAADEHSIPRPDT